MKLNHPIKKIKLSLKAITKIKNWWDYFGDYFGLKKGEIVYRINNKKIKTRAKTIDKSIFTEVALEELYFPEWLNLKEGVTIIDAGAHIGTFSVLINTKTKNAKVYSIEPNKDNYKILVEQTKLNHDDIRAFNIALSDKEGKMKLYGGNHSARCSLLRKEGKDYEFITTMSLKQFFDKNKIKKCDLLKMDIEGGEYPVLYSTPKKVFDKMQRIFIEIHNIKGESRGDLIKFIKKMGFKVHYVEEDFVYAIKN